MFCCCAQKEENDTVGIIDHDVTADDGTGDRKGLEPAGLVLEAPAPEAVTAVPIEEVAAAETTDNAAEAPVAERISEAEPTPEPVEVKEPEPEAPKIPDVEEFVIECTKKMEGDILGIDVISEKKVMVVTGCRPGGMIERWNTANPTQPLKYGSVICEVNGVSDGLKPMLEEVVKSESLKLKVRRNNRFTVNVEKKKLLGLNLKADSTIVDHITKATPTLPVEDLTLHGWNIGCEEGKEIMASDELVEINGKRGTAQELLQAIKESTGQLSMVFVRA